MGRGRLILRGASDPVGKLLRSSTSPSSARLVSLIVPLCSGDGHDELQQERPWPMCVARGHGERCARAWTDEDCSSVLAVRGSGQPDRDDAFSRSATAGAT